MANEASTSLLTLPLDVTDSQKTVRKDTAMPKITEGPAFCWFWREEGQSQPETCIDHSEQRGWVQHLLEGKFNHLQGTRFQLIAFASSLKIKTCTVSHHKMKSLLPSGTLTAIISSPSNSIGKLWQSILHLKIHHKEKVSSLTTARERRQICPSLCCSNWLQR